MRAGVEIGEHFLLAEISTYTVCLIDDKASFMEHLWVTMLVYKYK
jgi:hypothetical protein